MFTLHFFLIFFNDPNRVLTHGQVEQWRGAAPLEDLRMNTIVVAMNMREDHAFSQTEGALVLIMKTRGATTEKTCISLLNAELGHHQGG